VVSATPTIFNPCIQQGVEDVWSSRFLKEMAQSSCEELVLEEKERVTVSYDAKAKRGVKKPTARYRRCIDVAFKELKDNAYIFPNPSLTVWVGGSYLRSTCLLLRSTG